MDVPEGASPGMMMLGMAAPGGPNGHGGGGSLDNGGNGANNGPPAVPQLPPQMFTTAAQLLDLTDTNLVLQSTTERLFVPPSSPTTPGLFTDIDRGVFLVRGENVLLLGEIDMDLVEEGPDGLELPPRGYERAPLDVIQKEVRRLRELEKTRETRKNKKLAEIGFEGELGAEAIL
ncbi:U6 snRNA-associated Sm-like protein LSm1 [Ceratocystis lukuohia]|uniref:U6 snRNA-associated Sm-like protein LSm1 n=1 Tax=Ceratocystis lukuohia TaxID=2019550 RepID=A0ABR4MR52_9PEZI